MRFFDEIRTPRACLRLSGDASKTQIIVPRGHYSEFPRDAVNRRAFRIDRRSGVYGSVKSVEEFQKFRYNLVAAHCVVKKKKFFFSKCRASGRRRGTFVRLVGRSFRGGEEKTTDSISRVSKHVRHVSTRISR